MAEFPIGFPYMPDGYVNGGMLDTKIVQLINDLAALVASDTGWQPWTVTAAGWTNVAARIRQFGPLVVVEFSGRNSSFSSSANQVTLGTLPSGFSPPTSSDSAAINAGGTDAGFRVDTVGEIQIAANGSTPTTNTFSVRYIYLVG